jgi:membrane protein
VAALQEETDDARTSTIGRRLQPVPSDAEILHPRGRILPPLGGDASLGQRTARGLVRLVQGLLLHEVSRIAPAMAFHFFLSLLPLLAFAGYVVGVVAQRQGVAYVIGGVLAHLPPTTEGILKSEVAQLGEARHLGPIAAIGFLWIASGGIHGLMDAIEMVVGAPRRAWLRQRLLAIGWVVGVLVAFAGAAASGAMMGGRVVAIGSAPAAVLGLAAFYRLSVTHDARVRRRVLPGAALAVALWISISWAFGLYLRTLASYTVYYGSLAAVAVLIVWLWLMSLAILVGAELNSQLEGIRD